MAGHGSQQRTLPDTAAAENPHALAGADGEQSVDRADAGSDRIHDVFSVERASGRLIETIGRGGPNREPAVEWLAETIEDTADEVRSDGDLGVSMPGDDAVMQLDSIDFFERHGQHMVIPEPDYLCANAAAARCNHFAKISDGHGRPARSDQQANQFDDFAAPRQQFETPYAGDIRIQVDQLWRRHA
jgi:hypothetical protein